MNVLLATVALVSVWCTGCGKENPGTPNTLVVSNGIIVADTREKVPPGSPEYKSYLLEWSEAAEKGADARFMLHVVDQDGNEVADADVVVLFPFNGRKGNTISGKTDVGGLFSAGDRTTGEPIFSVTKKGYYKTSSKFGFLKIGTRTLKDGRWIPWNPTIQVTLKEMRNPIPMIAKKVESKLPKYDAPVGFDLKVGDWVAPHGKGVVADMTLSYSETEREDTWCNYDFKVEFPSPLGGAYIQKKDAYSAFESPLEAATDGYSTAHSFVYERTDSKIIQNVQLTSEECLVFRCRTETDEKGALTKANYGKFYGPFKFAYGRNRKVVFTYYFNPTPNDRNLEFDGKNNLLTNLTSLEEVYTP
jgi:hypothetical protein